MEKKVLFRKGMQRKFLEQVKTSLNCVSIRGIIQFDSGLNYSNLKNYYTGRRLISRTLFENLCRLAKIDKKKFNVKFLELNWGQVKGGKSIKNFAKLKKIL